MQESGRSCGDVLNIGIFTNRRGLCLPTDQSPATALSDPTHPRVARIQQSNRASLTPPPFISSFKTDCPAPAPWCAPQSPGGLSRTGFWGVMSQSGPLTSRDYSGSKQNAGADMFCSMPWQLWSTCTM